MLIDKKKTKSLKKINILQEVFILIKNAEHLVQKQSNEKQPSLLSIEYQYL